MNWKKYLFSNEYGSLRYKIKYFFKHKIPFTRSWNRYHNPLHHWWKARNVFKRPKAHFYCGKLTWFFGFPCRKDYLNKILDIRFSSLGWKTKYDSYRHEWDPYISIVFFRKWQLLWVFNWVDKNDELSYTRSMATWEALLEYLHLNIPIDSCIRRHTWESGFGEISYKITIHKNLKKCLC